MSIIDNQADIVDDDGINIIFLDVDGVLNSHPFFKYCHEQGFLPDDCIDPKAVSLINELVRATNSKIVVSSAWRFPFILTDNLDGLKKLLCGNHGIDDVIIGMTPDLWTEMHSRVRGDEIQRWMDDCGLKIKNIVILDDDADMGHLHKYLIQTSMKSGLQRAHILDAIQMLKGSFK